MEKNYKSSEEEVKKKLKIVDYNEITKEQINDFIKMIPNIDKEIAISMINQFPSYTQFATDTISTFSILCNDIMKKADKRGKIVIATYQKIIDTIGTHLEDEKLSKEERDQDIKLMIDLAQKIEDVNHETNNYIFELMKENSKNIFKVLLIFGVTIIGIYLKQNNNNKGDNK